MCLNRIQFILHYLRDQREQKSAYTELSTCTLWWTFIWLRSIHLPLFQQLYYLEVQASGALGAHGLGRTPPLDATPPPATPTGPVRTDIKILFNTWGRRFSLFCWTWTWNCVNWPLLQSSCHPTRNPRKEEGRERQSWRWKESDPEVTVQPWARCFCSQSYVPTEPIIWVQYILYIYNICIIYIFPNSL